MLKPEQVPDEVVKRFATWQFPKCTDKLMRSMLADAINAWPKGYSLSENDSASIRNVLCIILPLPQENSDG